MEDAVWLLEYISATKGADHLRLSSRHLNFFQYHSLDVILFLTIAVTLILSVVIKLFRVTCCSGKKGSEKRTWKSKRE